MKNNNKLLTEAIEQKIWFTYFDSKDDLQGNDSSKPSSIYGILRKFDAEKNNVLIEIKKGIIAELQLINIYYIYIREKKGKHAWNLYNYKLIYVNIENHQKRRKQIEQLKKPMGYFEMVSFILFLMFLMVSVNKTINFLNALLLVLPQQYIIGMVLLTLISTLGLITIFWFGSNFLTSHILNDYVEKFNTIDSDIKDHIINSFRKHYT